MPTAATITAQRTTGVAPCYVNFDALSSTLNAGNKKTASYLWDFGDPTSGVKNTATKPVAGHLFESAGTYTVTLSVAAQDGTVSTTTTTVTVAAFSGTTKYIDYTNGNDSNDGSISTPWKTLKKGIDSLVAAATDDVAIEYKLLLAKGQTHTHTTAHNAWANKKGLFVIGAYGTGANPVVNDTRAATGATSTIALTGRNADVVIMDVNFQGAYSTATHDTTGVQNKAISYSFDVALDTAAYSRVDMCLARVSITKYGTAVDVALSGGTPSTKITKFKNFGMIDVTVTDCAKAGIVAYLQDATLLNCSVSRIDAGVPIEILYGARVAMTDCTAVESGYASASGFSAAKIRGNGLSTPNGSNYGKTFDVYVTRGLYRGGTTVFALAPNTSSTVEEIADVELDGLKIQRDTEKNVGATFDTSEIIAGVGFQFKIIDAGGTTVRGVLTPKFCSVTNLVASNLIGGLPTAVTYNKLVKLPLLGETGTITGAVTRVSTTENLRIVGHDIVVKNVVLGVEPGSTAIVVETYDNLGTLPVSKNITIAQCTMRAHGESATVTTFLSLIHVSAAEPIIAKNNLIYVQSASGKARFAYFSETYVPASLTDSGNTMYPNFATATGYVYDAVGSSAKTFAVWAATGSGHASGSQNGIQPNFTSYTDEVSATLRTTSTIIAGTTVDGSAPPLPPDDPPVVTEVPADAGGLPIVGTAIPGAYQPVEKYTPKTPTVSTAGPGKIAIKGDLSILPSSTYSLQVERAITNVATPIYTTIGTLDSTGTLIDSTVSDGVAYAYRLRMTGPASVSTTSSKEAAIVNTPLSSMTIPCLITAENRTTSAVDTVISHMLQFAQGECPTDNVALLADDGVNATRRVTYFAEGPRYPDGSVRWAMAYYPMSMLASEERSWSIRPGTGAYAPQFTVDTEVAVGLNTTTITFNFNGINFAIPMSAIVAPNNRVLGRDNPLDAARTYAATFRYNDPAHRELWPIYFHIAVQVNSLMKHCNLWIESGFSYCLESPSTPINPVSNPEFAATLTLTTNPTMVITGAGSWIRFEGKEIHAISRASNTATTVTYTLADITRTSERHDKLSQGQRPFRYKGVLIYGDLTAANATAHRQYDVRAAQANMPDFPMFGVINPYPPYFSGSTEAEKRANAITRMKVARAYWENQGQNNNVYGQQGMGNASNTGGTGDAGLAFGPSRYNLLLRTGHPALLDALDRCARGYLRRVCSYVYTNGRDWDNFSHPNVQIWNGPIFYASPDTMGTNIVDGNNVARDENGGAYTGPDRQHGTLTIESLSRFTGGDYLTRRTFDSLTPLWNAACVTDRFFGGSVPDMEAARAARMIFHMGVLLFEHSGDEAVVADRIVDRLNITENDVPGWPDRKYWSHPSRPWVQRPATLTLAAFEEVARGTASGLRPTTESINPWQNSIYAYCVEGVAHLFDWYGDKFTPYKSVWAQVARRQAAEIAATVAVHCTGDFRGVEGRRYQRVVINNVTGGSVKGKLGRDNLLGATMTQPSTGATGTIICVDEEDASPGYYRVWLKNTNLKFVTNGNPGIPVVLGSSYANADAVIDGNGIMGCTAYGSNAANNYLPLDQIGLEETDLYPLITYNVTAATNASPIVVTLSAIKTDPNQTLETGDVLTIVGVGGNTAANGSFVVTKVNSTTYSLNGTTGNGAYTGGGTAAKNRWNQKNVKWYPAYSIWQGSALAQTVDYATLGMYGALSASVGATASNLLGALIAEKQLEPASNSTQAGMWSDDIEAYCAVSPNSFTPGGGGGQAPAAPSNVVARAIGTNSVQLDWVDNSNNEERFVLEQLVAGGQWTSCTPSFVNSNTTSVTVTGLASNKSYTFRVSANNQFGTSLPSTSNAILTGGGTGGSKPVPSDPTGLTATANSYRKITLAWNDNANNEDGYHVQISLDGVSWTDLPLLPANSTGLAVDPLPSSTKFYFRVRAYHDQGVSGWSSTANATTLDAPVADPPNPPTALTATGSTGQIALAWTDNSSNEDGFEVEYLDANGEWASLATKAANTTSHTHTGLSIGYIGTYRVRAYSNTLGRSVYSNIATATVPSPGSGEVIPADPTNLLATFVGVTSVDLRFRDNSNNERKFYLERYKDVSSYTLLSTASDDFGTGQPPAAWEVIAELPANHNQYTDRGPLLPSTTYKYRVRAWNTSGYSGYSNELTVTTGATSPGSGRSATLRTLLLLLLDQEEDPTNIAQKV